MSHRSSGFGTSSCLTPPLFGTEHLVRGSVYRAESSFAKALADYNKGIEINPNFPGLFIGRGLTKQHEGDLDGAIADYDQAIRLASKYADAYNYRGHAKMTKGDLVGALADLRQYCDLDAKDSGHAYLYIWLIQHQQNKTAEADQELTAYLAEHPSDWVSKVGEMFLGQINEADLLAVAASPNPKLNQSQHCEAWYFIGMKRLLAGDKVAAADDFRQCLATGQKDLPEYMLADVELTH